MRWQMGSLEFGRGSFFSFFSLFLSFFLSFPGVLDLRDILNEILYPVTQQLMYFTYGSLLV